MATRSEKLNRLSIASPCRTSWDNMQGDERRRYCEECGRQVHDLARLTPREIAALVEASRGQLCARITRDAQGRLVTFDPTVPELSSAYAGRWASPVAAAVVTTFLGIGSAAAAPAAAPPAPSAVPGGTAPGARDGDAKPPVARPQRAAGDSAGLRGAITDAAGDPLAGVKVTARNTFDEREHSIVTGTDGRFVFDALPSGVYDLSGQLYGFDFAPQSDLLLQPGEAQEVSLHAQAVAFEEMTVEGVLGALSGVPDPLRYVFAESDLVLLATAGPSVSVGQDELFEEVVTEITVTSTLKGSAPGRRVRVYHAEPKGEEGRLAPGARLLAFLDLRDGETGRNALYETAGYWSGLQALTAAEIEAYTERLSALVRLERHGDRHPAELLEWIVATVEEPLTREGAIYELDTALRSLEQLADAHERSTEQAAQDLQAIVARSVDEGGSFDRDPAPRLLAAFLTDAQKERLSEALRKTQRLTEADLALFRVVRPWAGEAAVSWLARQFQNAEPAPNGLDRQIMNLLAEDLQEEKLKVLIDELGAEHDAYWEALTETSSEEDRKSVEEKCATAEKELRRRFIEALGKRR